MRFEERELKSYAEPVSADQLKEGFAYFSVNFIDEDMHIPIVETLIFIGKNLDKENNGSLYFQDIESYRCGTRFASSTESDHAIFYEYSKDELNHIFEYERALDVLMRCSLRRRGILEK